MTLRLMTFNIWFSPHEMSKRMEAIGSIIAEHRPDVVALQEVTDAHWQACMQNEPFQAYHWSDTLSDHGYYTMLGSLEPFAARPVRTPFEASLMQRDLLAGQIKTNHTSLPPLIVGTSHLESLDHHQARQEQSRESIRLLEKMACASAIEDIIFCGDTNINEKIDGIVQPPKPWQDAWTALRKSGSDPGFTFDVTENMMMARMDGWARKNKAQLRFDRFWGRLRSYKIEDVILLGKDPLAGETDPDPIWPSDHFGLLLVLSRLPASEAPQEVPQMDRVCTVM